MIATVVALAMMVGPSLHVDRPAIEVRYVRRFRRKSVMLRQHREIEVGSKLVPSERIGRDDVYDDYQGNRFLERRKPWKMWIDRIGQY